MDIVMKDDGEALGPAWPDPSRAGAALSAGIVRVSSWMTILGTIRLTCALADYARTFFELARPGVPLVHTLTLFAQRNPPALVVGMAWPLIIALAVRRSPRRSIVQAAAATFLVLAIVGAITFLSGVLLKPDSEVLFGSLTVSRWGLLARQPADLFRALLGMVQLALEGTTACLAWRLAGEIPSEARGRQGAGRRRLQGRMALYLTLAFLVLNTRHAAWSTYVAVLNQSPPFRRFMLQGDPPRAAGPSRPWPHRQLSPWAQAALSVDQAANLAFSGQFEEARDRYIDAIGTLEVRDTDEARAILARGLNNLAWMLATCEDSRVLRPADALVYARRAVRLADEEGTYWNTLGVAAYRAKEWTESEKALCRSVALRADGQGDAYDWYFLAMLLAQQGRKEDALSWYRKAVDSAHRSGGQNPELYRFQVEAAGQLGEPRPDPQRMRGDGLIRAVPRGLNRRQPNLGPRALID